MRRKLIGLVVMLVVALMGAGSAKAKRLQCQGKSCTNAKLRRMISRLKQPGKITEVDLHGARITNAGLRLLTKLKNMQQLEYVGKRVMASLACAALLAYTSGCSGSVAPTPRLH